ncbi:transposase [Cetobacterium sp.]|uniref:transposase n=1 Tax=Cetobacterium sp. TaxID=2071632 RepID=UPI003FA5C4A2
MELGYTKYDYRNKDSNNSRNGYSSKKLKSSAGEIEVNVPRDRNSEYEPQVIKKHQNTIGQDLEAKIISMYAKGMITSDIESHILLLFLVFLILVA